MPDHTVLIVDDSSVDLEIISMVCSVLGCGADVVSDGFEAIQRYDPDRHSLVLCDYVMEPVNGIYVVSQIREKHPSAKCIMVSGYPDAQLRHFVEENQLDDLIVKPIRTESLKQSLRHALEGAAGQVEGIALSNRMDGCPALCGDHSAVRRLRDLLAAQVGSDRPFLLVGDDSARQLEIAQFVHRNGDRSAGTCVVLDCGKYGDEELHSYLIDPSGTPGVQVKRAEKGTLILKDAHALPMTIQRLVAEAFETLAGRTRIILLANGTLEEGLSTGAVDDDFYFKVASNLIELPRK